MEPRSKSCPDRRAAPHASSRFVLSFGGLLLVLIGHLGCARPWHPLSLPTNAAGILGTMQRHRISGDETLLDLTRRYDVGYVELVAANPGIDPWLPGPDTEIVLPTAHLIPSEPSRGIVINLAEQRLYFFPETTTDTAGAHPGNEALDPAAGRGAEDSDVAFNPKSRTESASESKPADAVRASPAFSFPIGVSRQGWATPLGVTSVVRKRAAPIWYPTASARREDPTLEKAVAPGPENPLGDFALYLGWPTYLIHGTNEPDGVGRRVSRGCIRLYPEDIEKLFALAPVETPVRVVHETVKLARAGKEIYLEVHPTLDEMTILEEEARLEDVRPDDLRPRIREFAGEDADRIDWALAYQIAAQRRGIPIRITR